MGAAIGMPALNARPDLHQPLPGTPLAGFGDGSGRLF